MLYFVVIAGLVFLLMAKAKSPALHLHCTAAVFGCTLKISDSAPVTMENWTITDLEMTRRKHIN